MEIRAVLQPDKLSASLTDFCKTSINNVYLQKLPTTRGGSTKYISFTRDGTTRPTQPVKSTTLPRSIFLSQVYTVGKKHYLVGVNRVFSCSDFRLIRLI